MKKILIIIFLLFVSVSLPAQVLLLKKPVAGDVWPGYSVQRIEWTSTNIDNIKIESSLDSGRTWQLIISSYPASAQYYNWDVPNKVSDSCFIRITDVLNSTTSSSNYKNNPFRIPPAGVTLDSLSVIQFMNTAIPVTWSSSGVRKLNLFVSYDNQGSFQKIADSIPANRFYYNWVTPSAAYGQVYLKLVDAEQPSLFSVSPLPFVIQSLGNANPAKYKGGKYDGHSKANNFSQKLSFIIPAGLDSAFGSETYYVKWNQNNVDYVLLQYSINDGLTWINIASGIPASSGSYAWSIPNTPTTLGRLRIIDLADSSNQATTAFRFVIRKKTLQLTSPVTDNTIYRGTASPISWNSGGISHLRILCLYQNKTILIKDSVPVQNETFNWVVPDSLSGSCKVLIRDIADSTTNDTSAILNIMSMSASASAKFKGGSFDGHSALSNSRPQLQLLSPKEGDKIAVSMTVGIKWKASNLERVHLYFSINNGSAWTRIASGIAASAGIQNWRTPNIASSECLLKIEDAADSTVFDISKTKFSLLSKQIDNLTDSLNWVKKTAKSIEWATLGIDAIRIYYKVSEKSAWIVLRDSIPASFETINWVLPSNLKDTVWIRLQDRFDSTVLVDKQYATIQNLNESFSVTKYHGGTFDGHTQRSNITKIIVQRPVENEVLTTGSIYTIKWTTVNLEDSIILQYSADSGATWTTIARTLANLGVYEWRIPAVLSTYNPPQFLTIKTQGIDTKGGYAYQTNGNGIANKCLIRALDPSSGNTLVGISSKPFTIAAKGLLLKADINFPSPTDKEYSPGLEFKLTASSQTGNTVIYFVVAGSAKLANDTLKVLQAGPLTIGAFVPAQNGYLSSDTVYKSFCINPIKPVINWKGDTTACQKDTIILNASAVTGNQWFKGGQLINGANEPSLLVLSSGIYTDSLDVSGCKSGSLPVTIQFRLKPATPLLSANKTSICSGDSIILSSSSITDKRWVYNGSVIAKNQDSMFVIQKAGKYQVISVKDGCFSDTSNALDIAIKQSPLAPQVSPIMICTGASVSLTAIKNRGNSLVWYNTSSGGSPIYGTPVVATDKPGQTYYYVSQVNPLTGCESIRSPMLISIGGLPAKPIISRNGDYLVSSASKQYKWYRNNLPVFSADSNQLKIPFSGTYYVTVSADSICWLRSDSYLVQEEPLVLAQDSLQAMVYPNPAQGLFFVKLQVVNPYSGFVTLQLLDMQGVLVSSLQRYVFQESRLQIPMKAYLNKSIYTIRVIVNGYKTKNIQLIGL